MAGLVDDDQRQSLGTLASALASRPLEVTAGVARDLSSTDGQLVYVDPSAQPRATLQAVAVYASMLAGSLARDVVDRLMRRSKLSRRYLAVEAHRASAC